MFDAVHIIVESLKSVAQKECPKKEGAQLRECIWFKVNGTNLFQEMKDLAMEGIYLLDK